MNSTVFEPMNMVTAERLLKEAKQILDKLGIVFFLRHGTCLGAVRDQNFISWDDDLDIGSVIGLHGLTKEIVEQAAIEFRKHGYSAEVVDSELHMSVDLKKSNVQMDWTCYHIIDDSIYQWPAVKIPVSLHENLKAIDFFGTNFMVPNPPEEYFRLKYGPDWMTPKEAGEFEQGVLDLMTNESELDDSENVLNLSSERDQKIHTGSLKVFGFDGEPAVDSEVSIAATSVLSGLHKSSTNKDGYVFFRLPEEASYVVAVQLGDIKEILYLENLKPGVEYLYKPDRNNLAGRAYALIAQ